MCGQVADGLATLVAGRMMDAFGHLKLWHAGGSALVALSFSSIFGGCLPCFIFGNSSSAFMTASYAMFASVFNVGWACVQVSHMALVACLTAHPSSRVALNSCRNAFTMVRRTLFLILLLNVGASLVGKLSGCQGLPDSVALTLTWLSLSGSDRTHCPPTSLSTPSSTLLEFR